MHTVKHKRYIVNLHEPVAVILVLVVTSQRCHSTKTNGVREKYLCAGINPHLHRTTDSRVFFKCKMHLFLKRTENQPPTTSLSWYLRVLQAGQVGIKVELDALGSTGQRHASNQQHDQHEEGKRSCEINHLDRRRFHLICERIFFHKLFTKPPRLY